jgi:hypothetical protein
MAQRFALVYIRQRQSLVMSLVVKRADLGLSTAMRLRTLGCGAVRCWNVVDFARPSSSGCLCFQSRGRCKAPGDTANNVLHSRCSQQHNRSLVIALAVKHMLTQGRPASLLQIRLYCFAAVWSFVRHQRTLPKSYSEYRNLCSCPGRPPTQKRIHFVVCVCIVRSTTTKDKSTQFNIDRQRCRCVKGWLLFYMSYCQSGYS